MWWSSGQDDGDYYQCPRCGYEQRSDAEERVRCHRCGRSYLKRDAKQVDKRPDDDIGTGFAKFTKPDD